MNNQILIYGKIIVDTIRLRSGELLHNLLGGGGPQAAFGARLWHDSVALLTRSGIDLDPELEQSLRALAIDLSGWQRYDDLPTPRTLMQYDEHERLTGSGLRTSRDDWFRLLARPIALSEQHRQAAGIHLITEFGDEPLAATVRELRARGMLVSIEPIFDTNSCPSQTALLDFVRHADLVTPDWPAATCIAGADTPEAVLRYWAGLGPQAVAIRHGARGSYVWDGLSARAWHIPALPIVVADPTGAGNAYGGGWCAGWQRTHDARLAGCYATAAAAIMVEHIGMPELNAHTRQRAAALFELALERAAELPSFEL